MRRVVCAVVILWSCLLPVSAQAASLDGPSSVPQNRVATLVGTYPTECGAGEVCGYTYRTYGAGGSEVGGGGDCVADFGPDDEAIGTCHWQIHGGVAEGGDPLVDNGTLTYELCEGEDRNCVRKTVTFTPWEMDMSIDGVAGSGGVTEVEVSNGGYGFPGAGWIELYDENRREVVSREWAALGRDPISFALNGCAGPYFRARYVPLNDGHTKRQTGMVRVNGITKDGEACYDDPSGGGDGGGDDGTGGGGSEEAPPPPTANIEGPASGPVTEPAEFTVTASYITDYPYWLRVRDADTDEIITDCPAYRPDGCSFSLYGDTSAEAAYTRNLVAETWSGTDVIPGGTKSYTFEPFLQRAKISLLSVDVPAAGSNSAGTVRLRIANADETPMYGYSLYVEARDLSVPKPKWTYAGGCQQFQPLACDVDYYAGSNPTDGQPRQVEFRAVLAYGSDVRDRALLRPAVSIMYGADWNKLQAAGLAAPTAICTYIMLRPRGPNLPDTSYPASYTLCLRIQNGTASAVAITAAIALYLRDTDPEDLAGTIAGLWHEIRNAADQVTFQTPGGDGGTTTTSGKQVYDEEMTEIARALRGLNQGVTELTLATAKAVAAACVAMAAYQGLPGAPTVAGVSLGMGFCRKPSMPIFIVGADVNEAAQHDFDAIFGHAAKGMAPRPAWAVLNYSSSTLKLDALQPRGWYRNDPACAGKTGTATGLDCDEYPYFSTEQGGKPAVPKPSLRPVDAVQNRREGRLLNRKLIARCGLESATGITKTSNGSGGSPYLVLPMPVSGLSDVPSLLWKPIVSHAPLTFGICNRGASGGGGGVSDS